MNAQNIPQRIQKSIIDSIFLESIGYLDMSLPFTKASHAFPVQENHDRP